MIRVKALAAVCLPLMLLPALASGAVPATPAAPFKAGVNYVPVVPAQPTRAEPGQIEVIEFFWFGCPHCFALNPYLESWLRSKPDNVVFRRVPAALNPVWDTDARAWFAAVQLGIADKAYAAIFNAIHVGHLQLDSEAAYRGFFVQQFGVTAKQFEDAWNSFTVDTELVNAKVLAQRYGVLDVPTLVVNGRWLTGPGYKLPTSQVMNAVSFLVQQEQAALAGNPAQQ
ncbi:MAG TPA: thiol:disulfide interchange protein DsbA/DsbL [Gammaproteobacteria bacterium]|nr:thiol:disulfide interchange protein DsbA/DsbL [Gammaproteobacteria bacterium]